MMHIRREDELGDARHLPLLFSMRCEICRWRGSPSRNRKSCKTFPNFTDFTSSLTFKISGMVW